MRERHQRQFRGNNAPEATADDEVVDNLPAEETATEDVLGTEADTRDIAKPAKNVEELMDNWRTEYGQTEDLRVKQELSYKMLKMTMALEQAKLQAKDVDIKAFQDALGVYFPDGDIAITPEGLESPPQLWDEILIHEAAHAGKVTGGRRLMDESMAEYFTVLHADDAIRGFYEDEQHAAKRAFGAQMSEAVKKYDFDNPRRLARMYLATKMEEMWKRKLAGELEESDDPQEAKKIMKKAVGSCKAIERLFKKAVPDLHGKLKEEGYSFTEVELGIVKRLYAKEFE